MPALIESDDKLIGLVVVHSLDYYVHKAVNGVDVAPVLVVERGKGEIRAIEYAVAVDKQ